MPVESFIFVKHASTGMKPENNEILSLPFLFAENAERIFVALADREISLKNSGNGKKPLLNPAFCFTTMGVDLNLRRFEIFSQFASSR